jgi:hypothetical protein
MWVIDAFKGEQRGSVKIEFDFSEVNKGWRVHMTASKGYRYGGEDDVIGVAVIPVKAIQIDSAGPVAVILSQTIDRSPPREWLH